MTEMHIGAFSSPQGNNENSGEDLSETGVCRYCNNLFSDEGSFAPSEFDPTLHAGCPTGRWYPEMPPSFPGETPEQYTDRLTGADKTDRRPYDHPRNRQCSIGYHDECSDNGVVDGNCKCPHHTDRNYLSGAEQERADIRAEIQRLVTDAIYDARNAGLTITHAAQDASEKIVAMLIEEEYL